MSRPLSTVPLVFSRRAAEWTSLSREGGRAVDEVGGVVVASSRSAMSMPLSKVSFVFSGRAVGSIPLSRLMVSGGAAGSISGRAVGSIPLPDEYGHRGT